MMTMFRSFRLRGSSMLICACACTLLVCLSSCSSQDEEEKLQDVPADAAGIVKQRAEKDRYFKYDANSPLPKSMRASFTGLSYFPYDEKYSVIASFEPAVKPDTLRMPASQGETRTMIRAGVFSFSLGSDDKVYQLTGYRSADHASSIVTIPFKDRTTGSTTYEAGRYVEVDDPSDECAIDFNTSYNPFCAFNDSYSCLLIPPQNVLPIAINAGEKIYAPHTKEAHK